MMRHDIALRALGTSLAALSISFAVYMLTYGGGKMRVNGMEYLGIFAQPRGPMPASAAPDVAPVGAIDMATTGAVAPPKPAPVEIVAARADRVWFRIDGALRSATPGEDVPKVGHVGAIVPRDGGWAVLDDKGATLIAVSKAANGAAMFARKLMFQ